MVKRVLADTPKATQMEINAQELCVGDIVLVKDQVLFTHSWPLALVTKLHPGSDGCVRTVTIRTSKGIYTRPIVKLVLLVPQAENKDLQPQSKEEGECSGQEHCVTFILTHFILCILILLFPCCCPTTFHYFRSAGVCWQLIGQLLAMLSSCFHVSCFVITFV